MKMTKMRQVLVTAAGIVALVAAPLLGAVPAHAAGGAASVGLPEWGITEMTGPSGGGSTVSVSGPARLSVPWLVQDVARRTFTLAGTGSQAETMTATTTLTYGPGVSGVSRWTLPPATTATVTPPASDPTGAASTTTTTVAAAVVLVPTGPLGGPATLTVSAPVGLVFSGPNTAGATLSGTHAVTLPAVNPAGGLHLGGVQVIPAIGPAALATSVTANQPVLAAGTTTQHSAWSATARIPVGGYLWVRQPARPVGLTIQYRCQQDLTLTGDTPAPGCGLAFGGGLPGVTGSGAGVTAPASTAAIRLHVAPRIAAHRWVPIHVQVRLNGRPWTHAQVAVKALGDPPQVRQAVVTTNAQGIATDWVRATAPGPVTVIASTAPVLAVARAQVLVPSTATPGWLLLLLLLLLLALLGVLVERRRRRRRQMAGGEAA